MLKRLPTNALASLFTRSSAQGADDSLNLTRIGTLYIVASLLQLSWPFLVLSNWGLAKEWARIPVLGWALVAIWAAMLWCIPHLFFIGVSMIRLSRNLDAVITQTPHERKKMMSIALLLILGIALDIIVVPILLGLEDKSLVVFLTGMMGGRILQVNLEGILQYHRM